MEFVLQNYFNSIEKGKRKKKVADNNSFAMYIY